MYTCILYFHFTVAPYELFPTSMTVEPFQIAFFPCQLPDRGQPLWVINGTEYDSLHLILDHTTNTSGLLVYARPKYNNTIYQCRYVTVILQDTTFVDKNVETSPQARLTVTNGQYMHQWTDNTACVLSILLWRLDRFFRT